MSTSRISGGIIALIAGVIVLMMCVQLPILLESQTVAWIINLLVAFIAIIGGILGIAAKRGAGEIVLMAGLVAIVCEVVATSDPVNLAKFIDQYSFFGGYLTIPWITIEAILMVLSSLIILTSSD